MPELPGGTVTFLFTDIEGSTKLWDENPETMRVALLRHDTLLREAIEAQNGAVFKTVGDAFCTTFARASDALTAALTAQKTLNAEPWPAQTRLRVRMALHTGAAEERDGDYFGPPLNRVARLLALGHGGQTLLSEATYGIVRDVLPPGATIQNLGEAPLRGIGRPENVFQLLHPELPAAFPPLKFPDNRAFPNNLPQQLTSFVGREKEIADVTALLTRTRLLTLTGSGGCGKTRLALQVAADVLPQYTDGVWLVELAALSDPTLLPQAVALALGVKEDTGRPLLDTLTDHLRKKSLLLLLDNCEHLIAACGHLVETLLQNAPKLQILATSRETLGVVGETPWRVPSLSLPDPKQKPSAESLGQYEGVRLFVERLTTLQPDFLITRQNAPAVAKVCRRLDGIPLALELAAARVKVLSVEQIAERLDDRFRLLTGGSRTAIPRQQTLRALIDWSYDLLSEQERLLLNRLSVFAGGWSLEAAEAICADPESSPAIQNLPDASIEAWEILDLMTQLVDKSLVLVERGNGGEARYRLLETVRQYSQEQAERRGDRDALLNRHRDFFLALAERAEPKLQGSEQQEWMDRLEQELDNLRLANENCRESEDRLRLAGALWNLWYVRSHFTEGKRWLEEALAQDTGASAAARAKALSGAGTIAWLLGNYPHAETLHQEALEKYREVGDRWWIAFSLNNIAVQPHNLGEYERAIALYKEALEAAREQGDRWLLSLILNNLGDIHQATGDNEKALAYLEEGLPIGEAQGDQHNYCFLLQNLANVSLHKGDRAKARELLRKALVLGQELGLKYISVECLESFAALITGEQPRQAAHLLGAADAHREAMGNPVPGDRRFFYDPALATTREQLGEAGFVTAWAEGRAMSLDEATAYALEETV